MRTYTDTHTGTACRSTSEKKAGFTSTPTTHCSLWSWKCPGNVWSRHSKTHTSILLRVKKVRVNLILSSLTGLRMLLWSKLHFLQRICLLMATKLPSCLCHPYLTTQCKSMESLLKRRRPLVCVILPGFFREPLLCHPLALINTGYIFPVSVRHDNTCCLLCSKQKCLCSYERVSMMFPRLRARTHFCCLYGW